MGVVVEYPIIMHIYNEVSMLLTENILVSQWMNHIGICHPFVWGCVEEVTVKFKFPIPFTKTLINGTFCFLDAGYVQFE